MKRKKEETKKQIRFFCDKCGCEVPQEAKACPECGCSFSSVKCPACGFTGQADSFKDGCPVCGYSMEKNENVQSFKTTTGGQESSASANASNIIIRRLHQSIQRMELPLWIYIITSIALIISIVALYFEIR
ncbi:MAG: zinc ribbon domain-containing protein [Treponema sp.]|nr:zinc ribbon domain-containing protein [Treponema sp.]